MAYPEESPANEFGIGENSVAGWISSREVKIGKGCILIHVNATVIIEANLHAYCFHGFGYGLHHRFIGGVASAANHAVLFCQSCRRFQCRIETVGFYQKNDGPKPLFGD